MKRIGFRWPALGEGRSANLETQQESVPGGYLGLAIWFGIVTGFGEVLLLATNKFLMDGLVLASHDALWMAPLANSLIFLASGIGVWFWTCVLRRPLPWNWLFGLFAFLGFTALLLHYRPMHRIAVVLLAAGLAVQSSRVVVSRTTQFFRVVRFTLPILVVLVTALAFGLHGWRALEERLATARLPSVSATTPNILLLILDTVRAKNLSVYGYGRRTTPNLEYIAQRGVRFDMAIAPSSWTLPSHGTMFTGRWPHELSTGWRTPLDDTYPTLAEVLQRHGYRTGGFVANLIYGTAEFGLSRGFIHYEDYSISLGEFVLSASLSQALSHTPSIRRLIGFHDVLGRKGAGSVNQAFLRWLDRSSGRPFFAFLNYMEAHEPYLPPPPFNEAFGPPDDSRYQMFRFWEHQGARINKEKMSAQEVQTELDAYDGALATLDDHIGELFDALAREGSLQNTLVIITSDHGEHFGEYGLFTHGTGVYMPTQHVPLMLILPGFMQAGLIIRDPVSLRDLPATIVSVIDPGGTNPFLGRSLSEYWTNPDRAALFAGPILSEVSDKTRSGASDLTALTRSLVRDRHQYIKNPDGREELYDLAATGGEQRSLAGMDAFQVLIHRFRATLDSLDATSAAAVHSGSRN